MNVTSGSDLYVLTKEKLWYDQSLSLLNIRADSLDVVVTLMCKAKLSPRKVIRVADIRMSWHGKLMRRLRAVDNPNTHI